MPQTEEHLAVLDLLGIQHAVIALTKIDRVDSDLVELATLEIEEKLAATSLEAAPIVAVSAIDGTGLEELRAELSAALDRAGVAAGRPRLWVDRAFTIAGAGTVVTGTLTGDTVSVGDTVEVHPGPLTGRVRSLQTHESDRDTAAPGSRVALSLVGLERDDVARGAMVGRPGDWQTGDRLLVTLSRARYVEDDLTSRGAYHLHMGSGAWPVRLRVLTHGVALLSLDDAIPTQMGDRFVLREVGRRSIVAGGRVLEPDAPRKRRHIVKGLDQLIAVVDGTPDDRATALLGYRRISSLSAVRAQSGGGTPAGGVVTGNAVMLEAHITDLAARAVTLVGAFHDENPLRPGLPKASLASQLGVDLNVVDVVIAHAGSLDERGSAVAATEFSASLDTDDESEWERIEQALAGAGLSVPRIKELEIDRELMHVLLREERLVKVSDELVYLPSQLDDLIAGLANLPTPFTVAEFRDTFDLTRKYAVPLVEWLDKRRITIRDGDTRTLA